MTKFVENSNNSYDIKWAPLDILWNIVYFHNGKICYELSTDTEKVQLVVVHYGSWHICWKTSCPLNNIGRLSRRENNFKMTSSALEPTCFVCEPHKSFYFMTSPLSSVHWYHSLTALSVIALLVGVHPLLGQQLHSNTRFSIFQWFCRERK
jgi:hypothetical protein